VTLKKKKKKYYKYRSPVHATIMPSMPTPPTHAHQAHLWHARKTAPQIGVHKNQRATHRGQGAIPTVRRNMFSSHATNGRHTLHTTVRGNMTKLLPPSGSTRTCVGDQLAMTPSSLQAKESSTTTEILAGKHTVAENPTSSQEISKGESRSSFPTTHFHQATDGGRQDLP